MTIPLIFLSSTVDKMQEERNAVAEVITTLRQKISRCEYFPATSKSPKEVCLEEAKKCDFFIGIYKDQYGNPPPDDNPDQLSVTEMEYDEAKKAGKHLLLFYSEDGSAREPKLESFLTKIKHFSKGHYVKKYQNIAELKYLVLQSLVSNLKNLSDMNNDEKSNLDTLVPDLIKYQKVLLEQFEYNATSGLSRPSALIQYRTRDLYIPPELQKYENSDKISSGKELDRFTDGLSVSVIGYGLNWEELEKRVMMKEDNVDVITTGINILDKFQDKKTMIILGDAGSGKSTLTKYLCSDMILNSSIVPIFINMRDFASNLNNTDSVLDYLRGKYKDLDLHNKFFHQQLNSGSCVVIFDGLDEVWEISERTKINNILQQFAATWANHNKVIITSRISGYFQNPLSGNIEILKIESFTDKKIGEFIYKWAHLLESSKGDNPNLSIVKENSDNLSRLIFEDSHLSKLASSPLILNIICMTFMKNMTFPKRKHLLYSILIETLLSTRESIKGIELGELDWTDYAKFLKKISFWMFNENRLQIKEDEIISLINDKLHEEGLTQYHAKEIKKIITRLEERSGLIGSDGIGNYFFTHLSFLEYFVAINLSENKDITKIYTFFKNRLHNPKNSEVISFISSILSDKSRNDSSTFLELVLNSNTIHEDLHLLDLLLVIRSLSDGALITDKLREIVFEKINESWTINRIKDGRLMGDLTTLISTPFEPYLVSLWREKCQSNPDFYEGSNLTTTIIKKSEYFEDLKQYCNRCAGKESEIIFNANFVLSALIQSRPSVNLAEYILETIEQVDLSFFREGLLLGLAKFASTNINLQEAYFRKIHEVKSAGLQRALIKYSYLIDKEKARKTLEQLPTDPVNDKLKNRLLSTESRHNKSSTLEEDKMKALNMCVDTEYPPKNKKLSDIFTDFTDLDEIDLKSNIKSESLEAYLNVRTEHDDDFLNRIMQILEELPDGKKHVAVRLCNALSTIYEDVADSREKVISNIQHLTEKQKRWEKYLQMIILKIQTPTNKNKELLLQIILDKNELSMVRQSSLELLINYFGSDTDTIELFTTFLNDDDLRSIVLDKIQEYPNVLKKHLSLIVSICQNSKNEEFRNSIKALRHFIAIS